MKARKDLVEMGIRKQLAPEEGIKYIFTASMSYFA